jgi:hypothetical protein
MLEPFPFMCVPDARKFLKYGGKTLGVRKEMNNFGAVKVSFSSERTH